ncbi:DUF402 domain-containing protein [soil metagenome]
MSVPESRRKYADRTRWVRVLERSFAVKRLETTEFNGFVTRLNLLKVLEPLFVTSVGQRLCIADAGYTWLQHFPDNSRYCVTTVLNPAGEVVHFYIDIADKTGVSDEGIPWWDDVYLDVLAVPGVGSEIIDEDDLKEGLAQGVISEEDAERARAEADRLKSLIDKGEFPLLDLAPKHVELFE